MESNRKRRGFIKGKLVKSLYRVPKSSTSSSNLVQFSSAKAKQMPLASTALVGYHVDERFVIAPIIKQKTVLLKTDEGSHEHLEAGHNMKGSSDAGASVISGDDCVDKRAAKYISYVRERFRLERMESERRMPQEI